jgi:S-adenosylmethionine:tRNA ribosyltransferase-isomerase
VRVVDGLITGWHEPESSHLLMLEAIAGRELLCRAYEEAAALGLAGHEFGDALLILP